jgi:SAM-dependent methyltransferase
VSPSACVVAEIPEAVPARAIVALPVIARNTGDRRWERHGKEPVTLGCRWLGPAGVASEARAALPDDVDPGELVRAQLVAHAPDRPGRYRLVVSPVVEGRYWFDDADAASAHAEEVTVTPSDILAPEHARAEVRAAVPPEMQTSQVLELVVRVTNRGGAAWAASGAHAVGIGHRWTAATERFEGPRLALEEDLAPGASADFVLDIETPERPGRYELEIGVAQEGVRWFSELDRASSALAVVDLDAPGPPPEDDLDGYGAWLLRRFPPPRRRMTRAYGRRLHGFVEHALRSTPILAAMAGGGALPAGYGAGLDERAVEFPWALAQLAGGRLLDAGSTLNHGHVLDVVLPRLEDLHILTLNPEEEAFWDRRISYVYGDVRALPYRDAWFDAVVCISTLEHVGMENRDYGDDSPRAEDPLAEQSRAMIELGRVLRPGGRLLVTVPFGAEADHGWMMTFSRARLDAVLDAVPAAGWRSDFFAYGDDGWRRSTSEAVADARSYDPRFPDSALDDAAKGARAVACVRLER